MAKDWTSYDSAATSHSRLAVPSMFAAPARDLVAALDLPNAATVLDVGTGSGIVAATALAAAGPRTLVIGLDPSLKMLGATRESGVSRVVAAVVPGLPFPDASFDRVLAGFVLSHVPSCQAALHDMARVLRPGGKLGFTAWGAGSDEFRDLWDSLAESFVDPDLLRAAVKTALPWEDWLTDPSNLRAAMLEAGVAVIEVRETSYPVHITIADFLAIRENSIKARFLRQSLEADGWTRFQETVATEFHARFEDPLVYNRSAWIAVGDRPHGTDAVVGEGVG
jgi:ubiquinone/menaquinone biosynthesis C-methylase UbiE